MVLTFGIVCVMAACTEKKGVVSGRAAGAPKAEATMVTKSYSVPPAWLKPDGSSENFTVDDLKKAGITFDGNARVLGGGPTGFGMHNSFKNHERLERFLQEKFGDAWKRHEP